MAKSVGVHEAKTTLSKLLEAVERGEDVVIMRRGRPVARLTAEGLPVQRRVFGPDAGLWRVPDDFDAPLPDEVLDAFEGRVGAGDE